MANTLTNLLPHAYAALDVTSREKIGLVQSVTTDAQQVNISAIGQTVYVPVVPEMTASDITASNISPDGDDTAVDTIPIQITNQKMVTFRYTGEEQRGLGINYPTITQQSFEQAFRTISNLVEADLAGLYVSASRAHGTAGTTPFGTADDLTDITKVMSILNDNGAPENDRSLILNSDAAALLSGKQPAMFKVNEAGSDATRKRAIFEDLFGCNVGVSGKIVNHTKGTGTGYLVNKSAGMAVGDTSVPVDTGTGTILAGDIVTFATDTNKYVVSTDLAANTLTINKPGNLGATIANNAAITVGDSYVANMAFSRDAFLLASRAPYLPEGGDSADDTTYVTDPVSGLTYEVSIYRQFRQTTIMVGLAWGVKAIKPQHAALLLG